MKAEKLIVALAIAVGSVSAFAANTDRDAPSSNALTNPSNRWVKAPNWWVQEQERVFDLDRAGFPQYSPQ
jgi:hypothetical protein